MMDKRLILLVFLGFLGNLGQAQNILLEKFTNVYCGSCPNATIHIEELQEKYPELIVIKHFKPIDFDYNPMENDQSNQLWFDMEVPFVPSGMVDRSFHEFSVVNSSQRWEEIIQERQNKEDIVDIQMVNPAYDPIAKVFDFDIEITFNQQPDGEEYRVNVFMLEDTVNYRQSSYFNAVAGHPLEGLGEIIWNYTHKDVVRAVLDDAWGSADFIPTDVEVGRTYTRHYTYAKKGGQKVGKHSAVISVGSYMENDWTVQQVYDAVRYRFSDLDIGITSTDELVEEVPVLITGPNPAVGFIEINERFKDWDKNIYSIDGDHLMFIERSSNRIELRELPQGQFILTAQNAELIEAQSFIKLN